MDELCRSVQVISPPQRSMGQRLKGLFFSRLPDMAQRAPLGLVPGGAGPRRWSVRTLTSSRWRPSSWLNTCSRLAGHRGGKDRPLLVFDDHQRRIRDAAAGL